MRLYFFALVGITMCSLAPAESQIYFAQDISIVHTVPTNDVVVGYANFLDYITGNNPANPTITLLPGGAISGSMASY